MNELEDILKDIFKKIGIPIDLYDYSSINIKPTDSLEYKKHLTDEQIKIIEKNFIKL